MGSLVDTIMWFGTAMLIVAAVAFLLMAVIVMICGIANDDKYHEKEDDEAQAEYMRQYIQRKEEKKRARAVSRELRRERFRKNHHGKGASAEDTGNCVLPEENPEGVLFSGQNQEGN